MDKFDEILDDCLQQLARGEASLEECLRQHPAEAAELRPLLMASGVVEQGRQLEPSASFRARARADLSRHMQANPRRRPARAGIFAAPLWRAAVGVMVAVIALMISGTVYAQTTLPGDSFYSWKITSEQAWRVVSRDPVGVDLAIAGRRMDEYMSVVRDPARSKRALDGYGEVLVRLKAETDQKARDRVVPVLQRNQKSLKDSGISLPVLDDFLGGQKQEANPNTSQPASANGQELAAPTPMPMAVPTSMPAVMPAQ